jgi:hypothetical protein
MAHVGSPDTFFTGHAGPYPVRVSVRLPGVIPGRAEVTVRVDYSIVCKDKATGTMTEFKESHLMRYFFRPEIELLLAQAGMRLLAAEEWMTRSPPSERTWSVCFVATKDRV